MLQVHAAASKYGILEFNWVWTLSFY